MAGTMLVANDAPNPGSLYHTITVDLYSFGPPSSLIVTGNGAPGGLGSTQVYATSDALPLDTVFSAGAELFLLTFAPAVGYVPTNVTVWAIPRPTTVQQALDRLAERLYLVDPHHHPI